MKQSLGDILLVEGNNELNVEMAPTVVIDPNYLFTVQVIADDPNGVEGAILDQSPAGFVEYKITLMRIGGYRIRVWVADILVWNSVYDHPEQLRERYLIGAVQRAIGYKYIAVTYPEGQMGQTYLAHISYGENHPNYIG